MHRQRLASRLAARLFVLGALAGAGACSAPEPAAQAGHGEQAVIFGADDRRQYYEVEGLRQRVADSTVALVASDKVTANADGSYTLDASRTYAQKHTLCSDQPFASEPAPAFCSGFMVGPDLIATAGHCGVLGPGCANTVVVFGFRKDDASTVRGTVPAQDAYRCTAVLDELYTPWSDYQIFRVDRPIVGRTALPLRRSGRPALGTPVFLSAHPAGIPVKVGGGATVQENSDYQYFSANLESVGGSSGGPVVNAETGLVEGLLFLGFTDYRLDTERSCNVLTACPDSGCPGWMRATRSDQFQAFLPLPPVIASTPPASAVPGTAYTYWAGATGLQPIRWSLTGAPAGMTVEGTTGKVAWTSAVRGRFTVTVNATNSLGTDSQSFTLTVSPAPRDVQLDPVEGYDRKTKRTLTGLGILGQLLAADAGYLILDGGQYVNLQFQALPLHGSVSSVELHVQHYEDPSLEAGRLELGIGKGNVLAPALRATLSAPVLSGPDKQAELVWDITRWTRDLSTIFLRLENHALPGQRVHLDRAYLVVKLGS